MSDRLLLDTHTWVWVSGEGEGQGQARLRPELLGTVEAAARNRRLFASAASVWEIALKAERGQALLSVALDTWVREQCRFPGVRLRAVDARVALDSTQLPRWMRKQDGREHRDPADRFLVATARRLNAVLLTCDEEILAYAAQGHLRAADACR